MKRTADIGLAIGLAIIFLLAALTTLALLSLDADEALAQSTSRRQVTVLASARRTATTTSDDILNIGENLNVSGAYIFLDVTAVQTTPLITLAVQAVDPVGGDYISVFTAATGLSAAGNATYLLIPGVGSADDDVTEVQGFPIPASWRVRVTHGDTDPITYSVGALLIP